MAIFNFEITSSNPAFQLKNLDDHAIELLSAGDKFLLFNMKKKAEQYLIENLKLSTVLDVVAHAYLVS